MLVRWTLYVWTMVHTVRALPYGAPNCVTHRAAPQDLHLAEYPGRTRQTGSLDQFGFDLVLDTAIVGRPRTGPIAFAMNQTHILRVQSRTGIKYRGILMLLHHPTIDVSAAAGLIPTPPFHSADGCVGLPIAGVTHTNGHTEKENSDPIAMLRWDTTLENIKLDVNVVIINNEGISQFYYTQFALRAVDPANPVPAAPTLEPTRAPRTTVSPTVAPTPGSTPRRVPCGLFQWGLFCPVTRCGWVGRLLGVCSTSIIQ